MDAQLKVWLACLQLKKEEQEQEFQLCKELKIRKLEAVSSIKMQQLQMQASSVNAVVNTEPP